MVTLGEAIAGNWPAVGQAVLEIFNLTPEQILGKIVPGLSGTGLDAVNEALSWLVLQSQDIQFGGFAFRLR